MHFTLIISVYVHVYIVPLYVLSNDASVHITYRM